ncbi:GTPase IMAP family member 7-like [Amphiura filiformis]|uniref:GTPase IMAP family member 7-like n=1 Tax=Amphiura filiformis TaxID=82378 RepID=UPI003B21B5C2
MSDRKIKPGPKRVYSKPEAVEEKKIPPQKPSRAGVPLTRVNEVKGQEYRIVLLGRTGAGKSATANTIFGDNIFDSQVSASSVTARCKMHKAVVQNYPLLIVDTPGLFDTKKPNDETKKEILKLLAVVAPGPHAIILVIPIHMRYTQEMRQASEYFQEIFGIEAQAYTMVLFTGEDNLAADEMTFPNYIAGAPPALKKLLAEVQNRYVPFDNRTKSAEKCKAQIETLMQAVKNMVAANGGGYHSNESFEAADKALEEHDVRRIHELETEKERKLNALRYPSTGDPVDLGIPGTAAHTANYKRHWDLVTEEINQKIGNARQDVRENVIKGKADVTDPDGWFVKAVKKVASLLGYN